MSLYTVRGLGSRRLQTSSPRQRTVHHDTGHKQYLNLVMTLCIHLYNIYIIYLIILLYIIRLLQCSQNIAIFDIMSLHFIYDIITVSEQNDTVAKIVDISINYSHRKMPFTYPESSDSPLFNKVKFVNIGPI